MSNRTQRFGESRPERVSGHFMAPRRSAGPVAPIQTKPEPEVIDLSIDDDDQPSSKPVKKAAAVASGRPTQIRGSLSGSQGGRVIIDLTDDSPSPSPAAQRPQPPPMPVQKARTPRTRSPTLPPLEGVPPSDVGRIVQEALSTAKNQLKAPLIKKSSGSFRLPPQDQFDGEEEDEQEHVLPRRQTPRESDDEDEGVVVPMSRRGRFKRRSLSEEEEEEDVEMSQILPDSPNLHSKPATSSIGSTSPLLPRLQQRRNSKPVDKAASNNALISALFGERMQMPNVRQPTLEELEVSLIECEEKMQDDHALGMRYLLQVVRERAAETASVFYEQPFVNDFSPWASKKGVHVVPGESTKKDLHIDKMESFIALRPSKTTKAVTYLKGTKIKINVPRVPKYTSVTHVKRSVLTEDDEKLKFHPYLGGFLAQGAANKVMKELEDAYGAKHLESGREIERASDIRSYLDSWLKELQLGFDQQQLAQYILKNDDTIKDSRLKNKPWNRKAILKLFGEPLPEKVENLAALFSEAFQRVFKFPLHNVVLPSEFVIVLLDASKNEDKPSCTQTDRLTTYSNLLCMLCGGVDCPTHGEYQQAPVDRSGDVSDDDNEDSDPDEREQEYTYERQRVSLEYAVALQRYKLQKSNKHPDVELQRRRNPCSEECYMHLGLDPGNGLAEWTQSEIDDVIQMLASFTPYIRRSCNISFIVGKPCWQVYFLIADHERRHPNTHDPKEAETPKGRGKGKGPNWYDNKRKVLKGDWQDLTTAHLHQNRSQANPCAHDGVCSTDNCPCFTNNILCESYCGCPEDCPRQFTGCNCSVSGTSCITESCICIQLNRECGPQCGSCGALPRINPANRYNDELFKTGCQNVVLQRGVEKKLVMGESQLEGAGFGLFVVEPMKKGDYLSEYVGEIISSAEAERRGIVYDRKFVSFLFNLNLDCVIDATHFGNLTRFINHAESYATGLNCEAKIVLVNGEHRIKFIALKDLEQGEELLFNYGNEFAKKHGLGKKLPKKGEKGRGEGSKGALLVGEDALDALDGISDEKRRARGTIREMKSGKEGAKSKAKKSAVVLDAVEEDEPDGDDDEVYEEDEDDEEEEDEEEEVDEGVRIGRNKRRIRRPARYTR